MKVRNVLKGILLVLVLLISIGIFAQDIEIPADFVDLYENYKFFFATYLGIAGVATFLGEYVIRLLKAAIKWQKVAIVSVVAISISLLARLIGIGFLGEASFLIVVIWGGLAAATAAGLRGTNLLFVKSMVDFVVGLLLQKEPKVVKGVKAV